MTHEQIMGFMNEMIAQSFNKETREAEPIEVHIAMTDDTQFEYVLFVGKDDLYYDEDLKLLVGSTPKEPTVYIDPAHVIYAELIKK